MAVAAERAAEVARNRAHISAFAAFGFEDRGVGVGGHQSKPIDSDRTRRDFEAFADAGEIIGARAVDLDGGEGRRRLLHQADEAGKQGLDLGRGGTLLRAGDDFAFRIVGRAFFAPAHAEAIGLGAVLHDRDRLRRLAEGDRQHA